MINKTAISVSIVFRSVIPIIELFANVYLDDNLLCKLIVEQFGSCVNQHLPIRGHSQIKNSFLNVDSTTKS